MTTSIFDLDEFKPFYADWHARQMHLARLHAYYDGTAYDRAAGLFGRLTPRLASAVRPLYLPVARAVNVDAGIVPGGWRLAEGASGLEPAVQRVLGWSRWDTQGVLFVHYGALFGCAGLRVSDLRAEGRVQIAPVDPRSFLLVNTCLYDATPRLALVVEQRPADAHAQRVIGDAAEFEYAEIIEPERVRTFANGVPLGMAGRPPAYANALGFVPFVETPHLNNGHGMGDSCFARIIPMLDQVNLLATDLADVIHRFKDPQYTIAGADPAELVRSGNNVWFLPEGARADILLAQLDIPGTLAFLQDTRKQVEKGMPELAFDELTSKDLVATATVELQLLELVLLIQRVRPNYDAGLATALRMAGRAAASMGMDDLAALDSDALAFDASRPVLPLDTGTQLDIELKRIKLDLARRGQVQFSDTSHNTNAGTSIL